MSMRTHGTIGHVSFRSHGFCIANLGNKYVLWRNIGIDTENKTVYVNNMKELKAEITRFANE